MQRISVTNIILSNYAFDINIGCLPLRSVIFVVVGGVFNTYYLCCCFVAVVCFVLLVPFYGIKQ